MSKTKVTVAGESDAHPTIEDCPLLDAATEASYQDALAASNTFSLAVLEFLQAKDEGEQAAWIATSVEASRVLFQPWTMEVLYVVATTGRARFTQLHNLLGMSTRTLSNKLKALRAAGLLEREVFDEQPVRIEYYLTRSGRATAALASPLFAHLNLQALRQAGRRPAEPGTETGPRAQASVTPAAATA
ncbi:MAG: winged helix-turn-helix transcriptional regulator [Thermoplasmatota archaeon]